MATKTTSLAILNSTAPFSQTNCKDALDIALIFGSYEQPTSLFFQADGVWQLIDNQNPETLNVKNYLKTFSALEFYDIENIYICHDSLKERKLADSFHIDNVQILNAEDFSIKLSQHQVILRF